jgi:hypothetical protein
MFPSKASSRKQIRQRLKSRMKPRGRPHLKHRRTVRDVNLGLRLALITIDFFAMYWLFWPRRFWRPCTPPFGLGYRASGVALSFPQYPFRDLLRKEGPLRGPCNIRDGGWKVNLSTGSEKSCPCTSHANVDITVRNTTSSHFRRKPPSKRQIPGSPAGGPFIS